MPFSWRQNWANLIGCCAPLVLIIGGIYLQLPHGAWLILLPGSALFSFSAWIANYRRYRLIEDTPTSNIRSAAQGYIELYGAAHPYPGISTYSPRHKLPCLWFKYRIERPLRSNDFFPIWIPIHQQISDNPFLLQDDSGQCVVDPEDAEFFLSSSESWLDDDGYRHTEWLVLKHQPLYALGEFITHNGNVTAAQQKGERILQKLNAWKQDQKQLLARFDTNQDGEIDLQEWEGVRTAAEAEILREQETNLADLHLLQKPNHGKPFLLASFEPTVLAQRFKHWAGIQLVMVVVALVATILLV